MLYILNVINSPLPEKRFRAIFNDRTYIDFASPYTYSYIDHHDPSRRRGYWKMMYNSNEKQRIIILVNTIRAIINYILAIW
jgi:hypothetical protein